MMAKLTPMPGCDWRRQALKRELARVSKIVERQTRLALAELDEPVTSMMGTKREVLIEGRITGDEIVVD